MKMKDVFNLPVDASNLSISFICVNDNYNDGVTAHESTALAINNHDALVEALEWALERAESTVNDSALPIDQIQLIKYQALMREIK